MAKPPYFPFYPKDFAADEHVEMMSTPAVGAYILLLCKAWHQEPPASLPDDDRVLARLARMDRDEWLEVRPEVVSAFVVGGDGRLHQKRLRREYDTFSAKSKKAKASAEARWKKARAKKESEGDTDAMRSHCEGNARASGSDSGSNSSKGESAERGEDAFDAFWDAYPEVPSRTGKANCRRLWARKGLDERAGEVMGGLCRWKASKRWADQDGKFIVAPLRWLDEEFWETDPTPKGTAAHRRAAWDELGESVHEELFEAVAHADGSILHARGRAETVQAMRALARERGLL